MIPNCSIWWKWKCAICSRSMNFPETKFRSSKAARLRRLNGDAEQEKQVLALVAAIDDYIPVPDRPVDQPFLMPIEDVFNIEGRGTVATGRVERGILKKMEEVEIVGIRPTAKTTATDIEMFRKLLDEARAGDNVGVLLRGTKKEESSAVRLSPSPARSRRTRSSRRKFTF